MTPPLTDAQHARLDKIEPSARAVGFRLRDENTMDVVVRLADGRRQTLLPDGRLVRARPEKAEA